MMRSNKGFTLVEILIVVIILGILAAIVIPQFTDASNNAKDSSVSSDLQTMRSQLQLYKVQHMDQYPNKKVAADGTVSDDAVNFPARLTGNTDMYGNTATGTLGPYMQTVPTNPVANTNGSVISVGGAAPAAGAAGWWFNTTTGQLYGLQRDGSWL